VLLARDAGGNFVSLTGDEVHARFNAYRLDVHGGRATLRSIVEREQLRLALDALVLFAHWVTPPIDTRQFDTRFFMARVPPESNAGARRNRNHAQQLADAVVRARAGSRLAHRVAGTDLDDDPRARAVRDRRRGDALGQGAPRRGTDAAPDHAGRWDQVAGDPGRPFVSGGKYG
jgi:hypothetical protein